MSDKALRSIAEKVRRAAAVLGSTPPQIVHFEHGDLVCGNEDEDRDGMTTNLEQVTCLVCLRTIAAERLGTGTPPQEPEECWRCMKAMRGMNHYDEPRREAIAREAGWKARPELAEQELVAIRAVEPATPQLDESYRHREVLSGGPCEESVIRTTSRLPASVCWNCSGHGALNDALGEDDTIVWVPPYRCPVCAGTGVYPPEPSQRERIMIQCFKCGKPANGKFCSDECAAAFGEPVEHPAVLGGTPQDTPKSGPNAVLDQQDADLYYIADEKRRYFNALRWVFDRITVDGGMTEKEMARTLQEIGKTLRGESSDASSYHPDEFDDATRNADLAELKVLGIGTKSWAVTVERNGEQVVTIASNMLAGRDLLPGDDDVIRDCADHLRSFVGPSPAEREQALSAMRAVLMAGVKGK